MIKKRLPYIILGLLVLIQFFQIEKTNPPVAAGADFLEIETPPENISNLIKNACYDCHAHTTEYPWYASIQPVGWIIRSHYRGARMNGNFSEWSSYSAEDKKHFMKECADEIDDKRMPMKSFVFMHPEAKLSDEDRAALIAWFKSK